MSFRKTVFFSAVFCLSSVLHAQTTDAQSALQQKLNQAFPTTKITADRSDIVTPGAVIVLHQDGLLTYSTASPLPPSNTYKHGRISQGWGGLGRDMSITWHNNGNGTANDYPRRKFVTGEKLWVTGITVQPDGIAFLLFSDPYDDTRYYGELKFPFAKGAVPSADEALKTIAEALSVAPPDTASAADPGSGSQQSSAEQPPAAPLQPLAPLAPPPPPADEAAQAAQTAQTAQPKTISLGEGRSQVVAAFGQPQKVVRLGSKEIDYYPDMKVTLVGGKVTDVQ